MRKDLGDAERGGKGSSVGRRLLHLAHEARNLRQYLAREKTERADAFGEAIARARVQVNAPARRDEWLGPSGEQPGNDAGEHIA